MSWINDATVTSVADKQAAQAERDAQAAKQAERDAKLVGVEFEGVMCSAHKEDQWGLDSVTPKVRGGKSFPFHFKNGNVLMLTPDNVDAFEAVWLPFRLSFFV